MKSLRKITTSRILTCSPVKSQSMTDESPFIQLNSSAERQIVILQGILIQNDHRSMIFLFGLKFNFKLEYLKNLSPKNAFLITFD